MTTSPDLAEKSLATRAGGVVSSRLGRRASGGEAAALKPLSAPTAARPMSGFTAAASSSAVLATFSRRLSACQASTAWSLTSARGLTAGGVTLVTRTAKTPPSGLSVTRLVRPSLVAKTSFNTASAGSGSATGFFSRSVPLRSTAATWVVFRPSFAATSSRLVPLARASSTRLAIL